jgi:hypothetical protein
MHQHPRHQKVRMRFSTEHGGLVVVGGSPTIRDCRFVDCRAANGAGSSVLTGGRPVFDSCTWGGNVASVRGAAFETGNSTVGAYRNCVFVGNSAQDGGAFASEFGAQTTLLHCVMTLNEATLSGGGGGAISSGASASVTIRNSVLWGNTASGTTLGRGIYAADAAQVIMSFSCLEGGAADVRLRNGATLSFGTGCLTTNPLLIETAGSDALSGTADDQPKLGNGSPSIDSAENGAAFSAALTSEFLGNRRLADGNADGSAIADMGAFERGASRFTPVVYVRQGLSTGANDGTSWANAYRGSVAELGKDSLQQAIAYVAQWAPGSIPEIWVASGTYTPAPPPVAGASLAQIDAARSASFNLVSGVAIYGGFLGNESLLSQRNVIANTTVLSGDLTGNDASSPTREDNSYHVVYTNESSLTATLDGFTITSGNASAVGGAGEHSAGGGFRNADGKSATFKNCTFVDNRAIPFNAPPSIENEGGAVFASNGHLVFESCVFIDNVATRGGAMTITGCRLSLRRCTFENNSAVEGPGGITILNGAQSPVLMTDCTFIRNRASLHAGAVYIGDNVRHCEIINSGFYGNVGSIGAVEIGPSSDTSLVNVVMVGNRATHSGRGGGIDIAGNSYRTAIINCTIVANRSGVGAGAVTAGVVSPSNYLRLQFAVVEQYGWNHNRRVRAMRAAIVSSCHNCILLDSRLDRHIRRARQWRPKCNFCANAISWRGYDMGYIGR